MEADRAETDIGKSTIPDRKVAEDEKPKQPRKRFIGRRAAIEKAEQRNGPNATIEDSGAIQGLRATSRIEVVH